MLIKKNPPKSNSTNPYSHLITLYVTKEEAVFLESAVSDQLHRLSNCDDVPFDLIETCESLWRTLYKATNFKF